MIIALLGHEIYTLQTAIDINLMNYELWIMNYKILDKNLPYWRAGTDPVGGPGPLPNGIGPSCSCCLGLSIYQRRLGKTEISSNLSKGSLAGSPILLTYYSRSLKCANTTKKTLWCFDGISEIQDSTKQPHTNQQRWHLSYRATKFSKKKKITPSPNTNFLKLHTNLSQWHKDSNQPPKISVASRGRRLGIAGYGCHLRVSDWGHQLKLPLWGFGCWVAWF